MNDIRRMFTYSDPIDENENLTSAAGRWTLGMFAVVVVAMVIGWFCVRGRINGNLMEEMLDDNGNDVPDVLETTEVPGKQD